MANITIFERDISVIPAQDTQTNVVYVPGYAIMGPINTPILCTSLRQFQEIFGNKPYVFEKNQLYKDLWEYIQLEQTETSSSDIYALKNNPELSYYYVTELLNKGLYVLFERVFDDINKYNAYAKTSIDFYNIDGFKDVMPEASADELNKTYQYIGETDNTYTKDSFYKCISQTDTSVEEPIITYSWTEIAESEITTGQLILKCKYPGKFYKNVTFTCAKNRNDESAYNLDFQYNLIENGKDIGKKCSTIISFNQNSDYYVGGYDQVQIGGVIYNKYNEINWTGSQFIDLLITPNDLDNLEQLPLATLPESGNLNILDDIIEFAVEDIYDKLSSFKYDDSTKDWVAKDNLFDKLTDRNEYNLKFITSGAYPTFYYNASDLNNKKSKNDNMVETMLKTACLRGDAIAVIDYSKDVFKTIEGELSEDTLFHNVNEALADEITIKKKLGDEDARVYGEMTAPWGTYKLELNGKTAILPGSFGYLSALCTSIKLSPNWYAVAGVTRAVLPNLDSLYTPLSGAKANSLQVTDGISINPITNITPYGFTVWGNRTLRKNDTALVASSFLNIRSLACDVKKVVYAAAKKFMFEPRSEILWLNFKSEIEPTLDKMVSGNGLTGYRIIRANTNEKATISAIIRLYAVEAVENFDITIELSDSYVEVQ